MVIVWGKVISHKPFGMCPWRGFRQGWATFSGGGKCKEYDDEKMMAYSHRTS